MKRSGRAVLPVNFTITKDGHTTMFVKDRYKAALLKLYNNLTDANMWNDPNNRVYSGRGRCLSLPLKGRNNERVIIRRYRHGGMLRILVRDIFWNLTRPFTEWAISETAIKNGLKTAEVVAVIKHSLLYPFYRAELITKEIENVLNLIDAIAQQAAATTPFYIKKTVIQVVAQAVRKMHDIGIYHRDLHLKNILLKGTGANLCAYIIDLDRARLLQRVDIVKRLQNLYRLDRSVEKLAMLFEKGAKTNTSKRFPITKIDRIRFFREYIKGYRDAESHWKAFLVRRSASHYRLHKLWWNILDKFGSRTNLI